MPFQNDGLFRRFLFASAALLPSCLALSACGGGGGGGVASIPPPPAPPPAPPPQQTGVASIEVQTSWLPSPATKADSYDVLGLITRTSGGASSFDIASADEFQLDVSKLDDGFKYVLDGPSSFLPASLASTTLPVPTYSWIFNPGGPNYLLHNPYEDYPQFFGQNLKEYEVYTDGSKNLRENYDYDRAVVQNALVEVQNGQWDTENLVFDAGLSYVAMGEWSWGPVTINPDGTPSATGDTNAINFVYGNRTPASGIPVSGTATYDARSLYWVKVPFALTADFGQRTISTLIDQNYRYDPSGDSLDSPLALGIHVNGSAPFSNDGVFDIPLTGTLNYGYNTPETPGSIATTGYMNGAFFGPHAEQVGGTFLLERSGGGPPIQDAFVGGQRQP